MLQGLSMRLTRLAEMVETGNGLADVGCDHGYLPILLIQQKKMERAIAMDINEGPLARAREHIERYGLADYIETRLSNGLEKLTPGEVDTVVIAGMGGALTIDILTRGAAVVQQLQQLVLEPQSELPLVRKFLREQNYRIDSEDYVVEDGKYYPILRVLPQESSTAEDFARLEALPQELVDAYGQSLLEQRHPVLIAYLEREYAQCESIRDNLPENSSDAVEVENAGTKNASIKNASKKNASKKNARVEAKKQELAQIMERNWEAMRYMGQIHR